MSCLLDSLEVEPHRTAAPSSRTAIVDYGLGNLFSIQLACRHVGLEALVTASTAELLAADAVILPGVGAFGDAMAALEKADLVSPLRDIAASGTPMLGICLGLQLLMSESQEFGRHPGLDIIRGPVVRFDNPQGPGGILKVPQVGWNRVFRPSAAPAGADPWRATPLDGMPDGTHQYFVHSFYAQPEDPAAVLSCSRYGHIDFCSGIRKGNVFAVQFHPERSGPAGLAIYRSFTASRAASYPASHRRL